MRRHFSLLIPLLFIAAACGDLKNSTPTTGGDAGPTSTEQPSSGDNGPGDLGALPTGYCCTDDSQCRYRHCTTTSAGKMCLDGCYGNGACDRTEGTFTCDGGNDQGPGFCQPAAGFTCIDPQKYVHGTRESGECCDGFTANDNADECAGGHCISLTSESQQEDNPYVCSQWCTDTKDCPSGMICDELNTCAPGNMPYTCK